MSILKWPKSTFLILRKPKIFSAYLDSGSLEIYKLTNYLNN